MSCHVLVPAFDELRPGTLSPRIVQGLLRDELGWDGLVFTDDMEMKAIAGRMPVPDACVAAVAAGCDAVLVCSGNHDLQFATLEALIRAVESGALPYARVEQALGRQRRAKKRFLRVAETARPRLDQILASDAHQAVADEMARFA
jgi:beta-N-acetylhexosaminidase